MTRQIGLRLELLDDIVLSATAATAGEHRTLTFIPGAALLGAAAGRLYRRATDEGFAELAFHSGSVRFGDGLPLNDAGEVALPTPLCLHRPKDGGDPVNLALIDRGERQWTQLRDGHVSRDGREAPPTRRGYVLRTAVSAESGAAEENKLFGYETLAAGSLFLATLSFDDDVAPDVEGAVVDALTRSPLRIGRSRNTEHGRVRAVRVEALDPPATRQLPDRRTVWALADLCLTDALGQPSLEPEPRHFGLTGGEIDWNATFLRTRRYAPWNQALRSRMSERAVIARGSVITFKGAMGDSGLRLAGALRECGLGVCILDPAALSGAVVPAQAYETKKRSASPLAAEKQLEAADHAFVAWLRRRAAPDAEQDSWAWRESADLPQVYATIRLFQSVAAGEPAGPTASQWGRVMEAAQQAVGRWDALMPRLFGPRSAQGPEPICGDKVWTRKWGLADEESVGGWLRARAEAASKEGWGPGALAKLARLASRADRVERGEEDRQ